MQNEISWLVRLGLDQGLITLTQANAVRAKLGDGADLMDFAQQLIDDGHVDDHALLEKVAGLAFTKGKNGPPLDDPFNASRPATPPPSNPAPSAFSLKFAPVPGSTFNAPAAPAYGSSSSSASSSASAGSAGSSGGYSTGGSAGASSSTSSAPFGGGARRAGSTGNTAPPFMATGGSDAPVKLPSLPFDMVSALEEGAVASAMRTLLRECARYGASDLHVAGGAKPFIRIHRALKNLADHVLTDAEARRLNLALLTARQREIFEEKRDFDYALALDASNRYRVNLMVAKGGVSGCYRMVPAAIPRLDQLGLRNVDTVRKLLTYHNGLILVTGPVGSGKTATLAALVAELNTTRQDHIITVEDPIEVVQPAQGCNVTQREVGAHTATFASALKGALREDPDVIVIGELRDLETIEMAITASETGHLVIGTMHTSDAATTLNRLLDVFPPAQQAQIRASVAESLRGILCQRLLPDVDGGVVLATEMLVANTAVSALIRDGKTQGLRNVLETGTREGMCLMENTVFELYQKGTISAETARQNIASRMLKAKVT